jgi:chorismate mutase
MCSNEIPVPGSLEKCIRVMMLVNTEKSIRDIRHIFLEGAAALRPDLNSQIK